MQNEPKGVLIYGDLATTQAVDTFKAIGAEINTSRYDAVFHIGDISYSLWNKQGQVKCFTNVYIIQSQTEKIRRKFYCSLNSLVFERDRCRNQHFQIILMQYFIIFMEQSHNKDRYDVIQNT